MAETTAIEWTDATFNPWIGCTAISPACDHCYAEALMDKRHHRVTWGGERSRTSASYWQQPRIWQRQAKAFHEQHGRRQRVFCASLADVFDNQVQDDWRWDLWALIRDTPDLDWQLLTKRPQNIAKMLPGDWDDIKHHVWLGTTVEDQKRAELNIPHLLQHDAAVRFISCEPLLSPIDAKRWLPTARKAVRPDGTPFLAPYFFMTRCEHCGWCGSTELVGLDRGWDDADCICPACRQSFLCDEILSLDWVIAGGESGPQARPTNPDWFRALRDQCAAAGVPFIFKQWGEWGTRGQAHAEGLFPNPYEPVNGTTIVAPWGEADIIMARLGKKRAGRLLDGVEHNGFPEVTHG